MEGDRLEADEVAAGGDSRRDGGGPRRVVGDHLARAPSATVDGTAKQTSLVDLKPLEAVRVDTRAG